MLKYTFLSYLKHIEIFSFLSLKKSFNYISLTSYVKIYTLLPRYIFFNSNNLEKNNNVIHFEKNSIAGLF